MTEIKTPLTGSNTPRKNLVISMFNNISGKYDFLNHFLSLGIDKYWRRKAISMLKPYQPQFILDIATGTGDLAISAMRLKPKKVIGVDISEGMLEIGKKKILRKNLGHIIELGMGDSENLSFKDSEFDAAMVAYGVRNFENLHKGLSEIWRVLKPGSPFIVLEFSKPSVFPVKQIYYYYFKHILPFVGKSFSKDKDAYTYLPDSVLKFPEGQHFMAQLELAGFSNIHQKRLTFGITTIYFSVK